MAGIYIHIPFCKSRCIYCDFYSTLHLDKRDAYVESLLREMKERRYELPADCRTYHTLYIGGGTPSTLPPALLSKLIREAAGIFPLEPDAEVTLEANPDDIQPDLLAALKDTPVNRISMGVQTFDDTLLKTLRRRHDSTQAIQAVERLHAAGYHNLSIDLIYGIPGQDRSIWQKDVETALSLDVPHLSAYSLMYEEGTRLTQMRDRGEVCEMDEESALWCFRHLCERLREAGYVHYEISNFARPGYHSRHNHSYWQGIPYLGFGPGAHSYDGDRLRRWNESHLLDYLAQGARYDTEHLTDTDLYNEYVMTRLRTREGIDLTDLQQRFGADKAAYAMEQARPHLQEGHLRQTGSYLSLTEEGIFISNQIMSDLFL